MMKQAGLLVLSGDASALAASFKNLTGADEVEVLRLEEKRIARVPETLRVLRAIPRSFIAFGCRDLNLQRYQFVLQTYLACSRSGAKFLLDESGRLERWNAFRYIAYEIPRFFVELVASVWVLLVSYIRLTILLRTNTPRNPR